MRYYSSIIICLISFYLHGQTIYKVDKAYTTTELLEDFDILVQNLESIHPAINEFTPKLALDAVYQKSKSSITEEMTEAQFHILVRKLIKEIGCGHTTALPSVEWYTQQKKEPKSIPLSVYVLNDGVYIKHYTEDSLDLLTGQEIVSINNRKSGDILQMMRDIQQRDGYTQSYVDACLGRFFSVYHLFLFGGSDTYNISYKDKQGKVGEFVLQGGVKKKARTINKKASYEGTEMRLYYDEIDNNLAILDIDAFSRKDFKKNYKYIFKELEEKQIKYLVIDLRDNYGGFFPNGNKLLKYLLPNKFVMKFSRPKNRPAKNQYAHMPFSNNMTKRMFNLMPDPDKSDPMRNHEIKYKPMKVNHFDGDVYVLTNGGTFSMGAAVTTQLKHERNAMIIGTETGGGENGSYAIINYHLMLPNTKIRVIIPYYFMDHGVTPEQKGRGVIPDIIVDQSIEDLIMGRDKEMEVVRSLIK